MKTSPICKNHETSDDHGGYEYDPHLDFTQFLEEARQHARETNGRSSLPRSDEEAAERGVGEEKKTKKSWKHSLFKWWKAERKSKPSSGMEPENHRSRISSSRKGHVSGPVSRNGGGADTRRHRQVSGPLANIFNHSKRVIEDEIPYMCLDKINKNPPGQGAKAYGPVYLVT